MSSTVHSNISANKAPDDVTTSQCVVLYSAVWVLRAHWAESRVDPTSEAPMVISCITWSSSLALSQEVVSASIDPLWPDGNWMQT